MSEGECESVEIPCTVEELKHLMYHQTRRLKKEARTRIQCLAAQVTHDQMNKHPHPHMQRTYPHRISEEKKKKEAIIKLTGSPTSTFDI